MKGNISRDSHRPQNRFSGVFQVQGGMVTDADLGEEAQIARARADNLGHDAVGGGVPATGGAVALTAGAPALIEGVVYAEGVRGETAAVGAFIGPLGYYDVQKDFPLAPPLDANGDFVVYVDVWERMVSNLEEPNVSDPGLHGVETAFRARTMTQIKTAPLDDAAQIMAGAGRFPRIGTGALTVVEVDPETIADECDPCADTVTIAQTVANALFRIEVLDVAGPADAPTAITIAWSAENGAAVAPATVDPEDFERAGAVYEFFSPATESHLGVHDDDGAAARGSFAAAIAVGPAAPSAPEGGDWPFVRRWDGAAEIDLVAGTADRIGGGAAPAMQGRVVSITVDAFTARLDFEAASIVAGDYWLIELRRFGETPVRAIQSAPVGVIHNYCPLFRVIGGAPQPVTDAERRKLSFPGLADLPASHVGFVNNCPKLYDDAENVQEALDNLCAIEAADIAFDPTDCPRLFDQTDNVQDALINLCKVDFGNERLLRLLHDWGVVCGVIPRLLKQGSAIIRVSGGAILDRAGELGDVKDMEIDLDQLLKEKRFLFDSIDELAATLRKDGLCLALAIGEGGDIESYLCSKERAFAPADPTFLSVLAECMKAKPSFDASGAFAQRPEAEKMVLEKVHFAAASEKIAASQRLNGAEFSAASRYNDDLIIAYKKHVGDEGEAAALDLRLKDIDDELKLGQASGPALETRRLQRESLRYRAVVEADQKRLQECVCNALLPRCPEAGEPPHLVPICCVEGNFDNGRIFVRKICVHECRKTAMSWRMVQYYIAEMRGVFGDRLARLCCGEEARPGGPLTHVDFPLAQATPAKAEDVIPKLSRQVESSFAILTGRQSASDYQVKPDIGNLTRAAAEKVLTGNGVEIAEAIDVADAEAFARLRAKTVGRAASDLVLDPGGVKPGDKVALILQDGVSVGYLKLEEGPGRALFERPDLGSPTAPPKTTPPKTTPPSTGGMLDEAELGRTSERVSALEERVKIAVEQAGAAEKDLKAVLDQRAGLAEEVKGASSDLAALETRRADLVKTVAEAEEGLASARDQRTELAREVEVVGARIEALRAERTAVETAVANARDDLKKLSVEQEKILADGREARDETVRSLRRNAPVTVVVKDNDALVSALAQSGGASLGAFAALTPAQLRDIATASGTNIRTVTSLQTTAKKELDAPIE
ncbi:MAG: DUF6519 domain-containing protein [Paracoccaceae bacterium]